MLVVDNEVHRRHKLSATTGGRKLPYAVHRLEQFQGERVHISSSLSYRMVRTWWISLRSWLGYATAFQFCFGGRCLRLLASGHSLEPLVGNFTSCSRLVHWILAITCSDQCVFGLVSCVAACAAISGWQGCATCACMVVCSWLDMALGIDSWTLQFACL